MSKKYFIYKVYDNGVYVKTWSKEVVSLPTFSTVINGMAGEMKIDLAKPFDEYGEDIDIKLDNRVDCYIFDNEEPEGSLLYRGLITNYTPLLNKGKEILRVTLLPLFSQSSRYLLLDGDNTKVTYNSYDPSDIFYDVLEKFYDDGAKYISRGTSLWDLDEWDDDDTFWDDRMPYDINDTNTVVSYTFNTNTIKECVDKIIELCPANWYYRIDPDDTIVLNEKSTNIDHDLSIGIHLKSIEIQQKTEKMVNQIYFVGGGDPPLFKKYEREGSINQYGKYAMKYVDSRVTVENTADTLAEKILDEKDEPETRLKMIIIDNNGNDTNKGYDIESIKVGQTIRLKNYNFGRKTEVLWDVANWDVDFWDYTLSSIAGSPLLVVKTKYHPNYLEVETSSRFPDINKRIEDINRNLENTQMVDNPIAPTT